MQSTPKTKIKRTGAKETQNMSATQTEIKTAIIENELQHVKKDVEEIKEDCSEIKKALNDIKLSLATKDNVDLLPFLKKNWHVICIIISLITGGKYATDVYLNDDGANNTTVAQQQDDKDSSETNKE